MKRKSNISKFNRNEVPAIQLIEEAFHLVRSASAKSLWYYFTGTIPFVCYLFYFWADMSRSSYAVQDSTLAALGLAIVYFWKCSWQAVFCQSLWDRINPNYLKPQHSFWQRFRYHSALWFFQAWALPLAIVSVMFVIPAVWVLTATQNVSALALTRDYGRKPLRGLFSQSIKYSGFQNGQNILIIIFLVFISLFAWINVLASISLPPQLLKMLLGIETPFSKNAAALMNSTFLFGSLLIVYLIISILLKGIYVLRCFYAESRTTGDDILSRLAQQRKRLVKVTVVFIFAASMPMVSMAELVEGDSSRVGELDKAIRDTMASKKYEWKFDRRENRLPKIESEKIGWLAEFGESIRNQLREIRFKISQKFKEWAERWFNNNKKKKTGSSSGSGLLSIDQTKLNSVLIVTIIILVAAVLGWLIYLLITKSRDLSDDDDDTSDKVTVDSIDLESEDIVADQLQEDEWMILAKRQIERGEGRLAIRALFLATLANLGERDLLRIQKYKSNKDYSRELELRARQMQILRKAFGDNIRMFELAWYGLHQIGDDAIDLFMENYKTITGEA